MAASLRRLARARRGGPRSSPHAPAVLQSLAQSSASASTSSTTSATPPPGHAGAPPESSFTRQRLHLGVEPKDRLPYTSSHVAFPNKGTPLLRPPPSERPPSGVRGVPARAWTALEHYYPHTAVRVMRLAVQPIQVSRAGFPAPPSTEMLLFATMQLRGRLHHDPINRQQSL